MADSGQGNLFILISPVLENIVHEKDREYIRELLGDFAWRARLAPDALFQQLSSLSVGPLITHKVGLFSSEDAYLQTYCSDFVTL